jgi:hypothetical protein
MYNLVLNSRASNATKINYATTGNQTIKYAVNLSSFLPKNHFKYKCQFSFITDYTSNANIPSTGVVSIDIGNLNTSDGSNSSKVIGFIVPDSVVYISGALYKFYITASYKNVDFFINTSNSINSLTVTISNLNNQSIATALLPDYCINISFVPVD